MTRWRPSIAPSTIFLQMTLLLVFLAFIEAAYAHDFPEPIRDTPYDWRCVAAEGALVSNHTRHDKAIVSCQKAAMASPGVMYYIEAGRYRIVYDAPQIVDPIEPDPVEPDPVEPDPVEPDPVVSIPPVAVYSYALDAAGELVDPKPLEGAHLSRTTVYFAFEGDAPAKVKYWCCKSDIEGHSQTGADDSPPLVHPVDLLLLMETTASHELYADMIWPDGTTTWNHIGNFTVVVPTPPIDPVVVTPEPATGSVTLDWSIPTERENGDALPVSELWGYIVMARYSDGDVVSYGVEGGAIQSYRLNDLASGDWSFAVKAVDTNDLESKPSAWVSVRVD